MRTKWMEKMRQESITLTAAIKLCKTEFAYLFSEAQGEPARGGKNDDSNGSSQRGQKVLSCLIGATFHPS